MRIKKKDIKESIEQLKQTLDNTEKTIGEFIPKTKETLEKLGFKADDAEEAATDIVKGVVNNDEVNEVAVSDSQIKFFNAGHNLKTEGDYAFTKGKLPKSVDENYSNFYNDSKLITKDMFDDLKSDMSSTQLKKFSPKASVIRDKIAKLINVDSKFDISVINIFNLINNSNNYADYLTKVQNDLNVHSKNELKKKQEESIRPKMTKSELIETVKTITEGAKKSRQVLKTIKVKNLRK